MRLAIVGKGGAGKSAICGTLARTLARRGHRVLALDVDRLPGLALSLGLAPGAVDDAGLPEELAERPPERGWVVVLDHRVRDARGLAIVREALPGEEILVVSEDRAIEDADREGVAPLDAAPGAPGVLALAAVARRLVRGAG